MSYETGMDIKHESGERCPACSPERDKGGRLEAKRVKGNPDLFWLGCSRFPDCKYSLPARLTKDNNGKHKKEKRKQANDKQKWYKKAGITKQEASEYWEQHDHLKSI